MVNSPFIEQKRAQLLQFIAEQADVLARQGSVQASWRNYRGRRLGPFFRLVFRRDNKQASVYVGSNRDLAAEVQAAVRQLQVAHRETKVLQQCCRELRARGRAAKHRLSEFLFTHGLCLKGNEVRGWRTFFQLKS